MYLIRPVRISDLNVLEKFANAVDIGMTHLPKSHHALQKIVANSGRSFQKKMTTPDDENYFFVLEEMQSHEIVGTCEITSKVGTIHPSPFYRIERADLLPVGIPPPEENRVLHLVNYTGPSEVGALYLTPEHRHSGLGRMLSLCRFLFMAAFPERFDYRVISNLRGLIRNNLAPFWQGLGERILGLDLATIFALRVENEAVLMEILPKYPIYISLLDQETKAAIGAIHHASEPAHHLLTQEGFQHTDLIDPVDGGPILSAVWQNLRSVQDSRVAKVIEVLPASSNDNQHPYILTNNRLDYRVCHGSITIFAEDQIGIPAPVAHALDVKAGDSVRYLLPTSSKGGK